VLPSGSEKSAPLTPPPKSWISPISTRGVAAEACQGADDGGRDQRGSRMIGRHIEPHVRRANRSACEMALRSNGIVRADHLYLVGSRPSRAVPARRPLTRADHRTGQQCPPRPASGHRANRQVVPLRQRDIRSTTTYPQDDPYGTPSRTRCVPRDVHDHRPMDGPPGDP
jgi:hypothetical protein